MYLVIEGPIGVGKTSLSRRLSARYGAELNLEVVEENPFLARFYEQPDAYAFQVQVFFLLSRFKQLSALAQPGLFSGNVVSDYLFAKDFIFAAMNLKDAEFALYEDLYSHLSPRLPTPIWWCTCVPTPTSCCAALPAGAGPSSRTCRPPIWPS